MNKISFCIFIRKNGKGDRLSYDHKPKLLEESERIQANGGFVAMGRVNGRLFVF
jgi:serine/threonine protein phosphatase PrpC